jgi:hypothetical protein
MHTVHLKTFNSFGHRTIQSHVIQFPFIKSLSGTLAGLAVGWSAVLRANTGDTLSSSVDSNPPIPAVLSCFFLRPENIDGKGWLTDRPWPRLPLVWEGTGRVGMPYAFSSISASVTLMGPPIGRAGDAAPAESAFCSLRELEESGLLDQGAIAVLSIVGCSLQVVQRLYTDH